jgi:hypothetical protein
LCYERKRRPEAKVIIPHPGAVGAERLKRAAPAQLLTIQGAGVTLDFEADPKKSRGGMNRLIVYGTALFVAGLLMRSALASGTSRSRNAAILSSAEKGSLRDAVAEPAPKDEWPTPEMQARAYARLNSFFKANISLRCAREIEVADQRFLLEKEAIVFYRELHPKVRPYPAPAPNKPNVVMDESCNLSRKDLLSRQFDIVTDRGDIVLVAGTPAEIADAMKKNKLYSMEVMGIGNIGPILRQALESIEQADSKKKAEAQAKAAP